VNEDTRLCVIPVYSTSNTSLKCTTSMRVLRNGHYEYATILCNKAGYLLPFTTEIIVHKISVTTVCYAWLL